MCVTEKKLYQTAVHLFPPAKLNSFTIFLVCGRTYADVSRWFTRKSKVALSLDIGYG